MLISKLRSLCCQNARGLINKRMDGALHISHRSWRSMDKNNLFDGNSANLCNDAVESAIIGSEGSSAHSCDVSSIKRVGAAAADDLEPLMKLTSQAHEAGGREGKGRRRGLKYTTEFRNCTLFPLLMNKGIGSVDLDQGFAPMMYGCMHTPASMPCLPACLPAEEFRHRGYGCTTGLQHSCCYCFCFVQCCQPKPRKDKTIGGLCFGNFEVFLFLLLLQVGQSCLPGL